MDTLNDDFFEFLDELDKEVAPKTATPNEPEVEIDVESIIADTPKQSKVAELITKTAIPKVTPKVVCDIDLEELLPTPTVETGGSEKNLIIDADGILYTVASIIKSPRAKVATREVFPMNVLPRFMVNGSLDARKWVGSSITEVIRDGRVQIYNKRLLENRIRHYIDKTIESVEPTKTTIVIGKGRWSFRYKISPSYKAKRKAKNTYVGVKDNALPLPLEVFKFFETTIRNLVNESNGRVALEVCTEYEADDLVVLLSKTLENAVVSAVDKDVIGNVVCPVWNYTKQEWLQINSPRYVREFQYFQCLVGDSTDGISGCPNIGKVGASSRIAEADSSEWELWQTVLSAYREKFESPIEAKEEAVLNMRLVSMHQLNEKREVVLWTPPTRR